MARTLRSASARPHLNSYCIDLMLPSKDSLEICREVRAFSEVPIVMVTARVGPHHGGAFFLHGLKLSEEQHDKIFAIEYAQMPQAREQRKAIEHARRDLHQMVVSGQYDEARARTLTEAQLRSQAGAKIMQVLTPEQRKQVEEREAQRVAELERGEGAQEPVSM